MDAFISAFSSKVKRSKKNDGSSAPVLHAAQQEPPPPASTAASTAGVVPPADNPTAGELSDSPEVRRLKAQIAEMAASHEAREAETKRTNEAEINRVNEAREADKRMYEAREAEIKQASEAREAEIKQASEAREAELKRVHKAEKEEVVAAWRAALAKVDAGEVELQAMRNMLAAMKKDLDERERVARENRGALRSFLEATSEGRPVILSELKRHPKKSRATATATERFMEMTAPPTPPKPLTHPRAASASRKSCDESGNDGPRGPSQVHRWSDAEIREYLMTLDPSGEELLEKFKTSPVSSEIFKRFQGKSDSWVADTLEAEIGSMYAEAFHVWDTIIRTTNNGGPDDDAPADKLEMKHCFDNFAHIVPPPFNYDFKMDAVLEIAPRGAAASKPNPVAPSPPPSTTTTTAAPAARKKSTTTAASAWFNHYSFGGKAIPSRNKFENKLHGAVVLECKHPGKLVNCYSAIHYLELDEVKSVLGLGATDVVGCMCSSYYDPGKCPVRQCRHYMLMHLVRFGIVSGLNYFILLRLKNNGDVLISKIFLANDPSPLCATNDVVSQMEGGNMSMWELLVRFVCKSIGRSTFAKIPRVLNDFFVGKLNNDPEAKFSAFAGNSQQGFEFGSQSNLDFYDANDGATEDITPPAEEEQRQTTTTTSHQGPPSSGGGGPGGSSSSGRRGSRSGGGNSSSTGGGGGSSSFFGGSAGNQRKNDGGAPTEGQEVEEDETYTPREDLSSDEVLVSLGSLSPMEICARYGGNAAWTTRRERRGLATEGNGFFLPFEWPDLHAPARFDFSLPREIVLSPFPLQGDARVLSQDTRTGVVFLQTLGGRECVFKTLFLDVPRGELDGEKRVLPVRVQAELLNEKRVYAHLSSMPAMRGKFPEYYWHGALKEHFFEALVLGYVPGGPLASRDDGLAAAALIDELHAAGVLHGDVHAGNFIVREDQATKNNNNNSRPPPRLIVLDFGFSKLESVDFLNNPVGWREAVRAERAKVSQMVDRFFEVDEVDPTAIEPLGKVQSLTAVINNNTTVVGQLLGSESNR